VLPKITVVEQVLCYCSALAALLQSFLGLVISYTFCVSRHVQKSISGSLGRWKAISQGALPFQADRSENSNTR
jgi:hypothetical protein